MTRSGVRMPVAERMARFTDKSGGPDACWPWTGGHTNGGYGLIVIENRTMTAHRAAYELRHGPVPDGVQVCHHCDNPPCVNPAHLFMGAPKDNAQDMVAKGRARGGAKNPLKGEQIAQAKLTEEQVIDLRRQRTEGVSHRDLAARFGVALSTVERICRGADWKHLAGIDQQAAREAAHERRRRSSNHSNSRLTPDAVRQIRASADLPLHTLAERFGVSMQAVANVRNGKTWTEVV